MALLSSKLAADLVPRLCDCDYCVGQGAAYISDCDGRITITAAVELKKQMQGSQQAQFLCCTQCECLVAVVYETAQGLIGAVNASILSCRQLLPDAVSVSPKKLAPQDKVDRWLAMWSKVNINKT